MSSRRHLVRVRWLLVAIAALLLGIDRFAWPLTQRIENLAADTLVSLDASRRAPVPGIVLVNIDEHSLDAMTGEFGRWPWPRSVHAELLENLLRQSPRAIVFDILFSDYDAAQPAADKYLVDIAVPAENVFFPLHVLAENDGPGLSLDEWGYRLGFEKTTAARAGAELHFIPSLRPLTETGRTGAISAIEDPDGVLRRYAVHFERQGWQVPSLPAKVAAFLGAPLPTTDRVRLHWNGRPDDREQYSFSDVFRDLSRETPDVFEGVFTDTIVIIGGNAPSLHDLKVTPVSNLHPGADILATSLDNLLQQDWLRDVSPWLELLGGFVLIAAVAASFHLGRGLMLGGILVIAGSMLWLLFAWQALAYNQQAAIVPVLAYPVLLFIALGLYQALHERAARDQAIATFGRFIDPRVVEGLVKDDSDILRAAPQSREITVLFSDIRGFTTLSETRQPEEIVALLNRYFARQVDVIFQYGGTIDKFIGDAIMAFWGAPVEDPQQAENAVLAALEMTRVVESFRKELAETGVDFDIGIGLHTGPAVVGFIGADNRLDYTAIGDTVNLASRIEGQTKGLARILVSEDTRARCNDRFDFIDHGEFNVKGRSRAVHLYEPRG